MEIIKEYSIRKTLKTLSKQRVALILQPGNVWVIEKSVGDDEKTEVNLRTCHIRGWIEPIENAIPKGDLTPDGKLPEGYLFTKHGPLYRLTDSGWNAIHRSHVITLLGLIVSVLALGLIILSLQIFN